jgi:hypothetical protein
MVPADRSGPAFVLPGQGKMLPVSYQQYQLFFKKCLDRVGQDSSLFSYHSFRRGGATWAFRSGVPGELVKVHGDWVSEAYLKYLDFSLDQRLRVANGMVKSLSELVSN